VANVIVPLLLLVLWLLQAGVVKAHMLLLAHLERLGNQVPPALQADYK
jgi:hypothetical protein